MAQVAFKARRPGRTVLLIAGVVVWAFLGYLAIDGAVNEANGKITASARAALEFASRSPVWR